MFCSLHYLDLLALPCHLPPAASDWRITKTRDRWAWRKQTQNGIASQWSACQFRSPSAKGKVKISCQADCAIIGFSVLLFCFFNSHGEDIVGCTQSPPFLWELSTCFPKLDETARGRTIKISSAPVSEIFPTAVKTSDNLVPGKLALSRLGGLIAKVGPKSQSQLWWWWSPPYSRNIKMNQISAFYSLFHSSLVPWHRLWITYCLDK